LKAGWLEVQAKKTDRKTFFPFGEVFFDNCID